MVQRTVLKVDISCLKCKRQLLKAVATLEGVDKIDIDAAKGTLTVTGNADPYEIITRTIKTGKHVEVVSIGPPPPPPKRQDGQKKGEEKKTVDSKPEEKNKEQLALSPIHDPRTCPQCQRIIVMPVDYNYQPNPTCSIM